MAEPQKIYQVLPEIYPHLVQTYNSLFYDGDGNLIPVSSTDGVQGPQGAGGVPTVLNNTFTSSLVLTVTHSFGYYPVVQIIDNNYQQIVPNLITHNSVNDYTVIFATSTSGFVITGGGTEGPQGSGGGTTGSQGNTGPQGFQGPTGPMSPTHSLAVVLSYGNTASTSIDMSNYPITNLDYLSFYTASVATSAVGRLVWNDTDGTLNLGLKGGNVTLQIGQEEVVRVVNKSGENLLESQYKVVRVRLTSEGGAQGQRLAVVLSQGDNDPDSATTLGVVTENINNNAEGFITTYGLVNNINTTATSFHGESWSEGDVLYLSSSVPGGLTNVKPVAPNHTVIVGFVVYTHQSNGKIFVKVDNGYELKELHDVYYTTPNDGDVLQWSGTGSRWEARPFTGGTGSGSGGTGSQGPMGPTGLGGTIANYGYFYDTTTQTNAGATAVNPMTFNTTDLSVGVSIVSNSRMTIANSGVYNIQFSAQIEKTDAGTDVIDIWLRKNGNDVVDSSGSIEVSGAGAEYIAAWNYLVQSNANDYYEIVWSSADLNIRLLATGTQSSPTRPAVPSVIASVTQVTYTQIGPTGSQGLMGQQGNQGFQGMQGPQGIQGLQGPQGIQGLQGPQGNQGNTGSQGSTGPQGFQGLQGPLGVQGFTGPQGSTGFQGSTGNQGFTGPQGFQGNQGFQGPTGPQGTNGTIGVQGFTGPQGFQGISGPQGPGGSGNYVISATAPSGPTSGDRWYDLTSGLEYVYINDGDSSQWISPGQAGPQGPTGPGTLNSGTVNQVAYYTATTTLSGTSNLTIATNSVTVNGTLNTGTISTVGSIIATGSVRISNTLTTGTVSVLGNITATGSLSVSNNITAGTISATNQISAGTFNAATYQIATFKALDGPAFSAYGSVATTLNNGVVTKITLDAEEFDTDSAFSTSTYRFTPALAGYYQFHGHLSVVTYASNTSSQIMSLYKNGYEYKRGVRVPCNTVGVGTMISAIIFMDGITDYIEMYGLQSSGGNVTSETGQQFGPYLQGNFVKPPIYTYVSVQYLVIGGGGGGGCNWGGGGGGGAFVEGTTGFARGFLYDVIIGTGGNGATTTGAGGNGGSSTITGVKYTSTTFTITGSGGGGGGYNISGSSAATGNSNGNGSGGGAGYPGSGGTVAGGSGVNSVTIEFSTVNSYNSGGQSLGISVYGCGGGGGAGAVGTEGQTSQAGGNGGAGKISTITGASVYYSAGGGGGGGNGSVQSSGGTGNTGGKGGNTTGGAGTNGAGGYGMGGGGGATNGGQGGNGSNGVVIFRVLTSQNSGATGTYTTTTDGLYTIFTFTGDGAFIP